MKKPLGSRLARAHQKPKPAYQTLAEMLKDMPPLPVATKKTQRAPPAIEAGPPPPPPPPVEALPPPPPPQPSPWWEEYTSYRPRDASLYRDDGVRYRTVHDYDPLERAIHELDDD
jgi:type IV secretory pathway VirB10-like protein